MVKKGSFIVMKAQNKYLKRGVSARKEEVHQAIKSANRGLYPGAFCKAVADISGNKESVFIMHADGAGSKSSLAYLYWRETGDISVFKGIAQDALVMNIDDMLCVGCIGPTFVSSTIGRNKHRIPGEVIAEIICGSQAFLELMNAHGGQFKSTGGETADLGDLISTLVVDTTMAASVKKSDFIDAANIQSGQVIVGLASFGQASYEDTYNAGMGSNGLTSARHDLFHSAYIDKYPESYDSSFDSDLMYTGKHGVKDPFKGADMDMGKAVLSPTRSYFPILYPLLTKKLAPIYGMIHCTGGGQIKCLKFGTQVHYIKDNLFPFPPLFQALEEITEIQEMFEIFNCGHRMEIYTDVKGAEEIIAVATSYNVEAKIIGHTEFSEKNRVTIKHKGKEYFYS